MANVSGFTNDYSDDSFWNKISSSFGAIGKELLYNVLLLYYILQSSTTPATAKLLIVGGLGYFISPIDIVPDIIVGLGYTDDLAVILGVISSVIIYATPEIKARAKRKINEFFGDHR